MMAKTKEYTIYCATNMISNKSYIGQSSNFEKRKRAHISNANNKHKRYGFQSAILKYGKEAFVWQILETHTTLDACNEAEEFFIAYLGTLAPNGYNLTKGGNNHEPTEDVKKRISEKLKTSGFFIGKKGKDHPRFGIKRTQESNDALSKRLSGENGPSCKLTNAEARNIYQDYIDGLSRRELVEKYNLSSRSTITRIINKLCWKDATKDLPDIDTNIRSRGEGLPFSKLKEYQVIEIIAKAKVMTEVQKTKCSLLGAEYGVSGRTIYQILMNINWKHLPR